MDSGYNGWKRGYHVNLPIKGFTNADVGKILSRNSKHWQPS